MQPYYNFADDFLWNSCLLCMFLSVYMGQLSSLDVEPFSDGVTTGILIFAATYPLVLAVCITVWELKHARPAP